MYRPQRVNCVFRFSALITLCLAATFTVCPAWPQTDAASLAVLDSRQLAETLIGQGDLVGAGTVLAGTFRNLPVDRPDLVDCAGGSLQLCMFLMEYLMPDAVQKVFIQNYLDPDRYETDRLILVTYNIAIGQESDGKAVAAQEMTQLVASENPAVRIIAAFMLSNPYFFDDAQFTGQYQALLASEYPELEVTQWALRGSIYTIRAEDLTVVQNTVETVNQVEFTETVETKSAEPARRTVRPAEKDRVYSLVQNALEDLRDPESVDEGVTALCRAAVEEPKWQDRYGAMLMVEPYAGRGHQAAVEQAALETLSRVETPTPDVIQAEAVLAKIACRRLQGGGQDAPPVTGMVQSAEQLLAKRWDINPFDRVLYEVVMRSVRRTAETLAQCGEAEAAVSVYRELAAKYPKSLVAEACEIAIARLGSPPG